MKKKRQDKKGWGKVVLMKINKKTITAAISSSVRS
jgi:hypothetical protein